MRNTNRILLLGVTPVVMLAGAGAVTVAALRQTPDGVIAQGVHVAGMDWSGKTTAVARAELEGWKKARLDEPLAIKLPEDVKPARQWTPKRKELGADIDVAGTLDKASTVGRDQGTISRMASFLSGAKTVDIAPLWVVDKAKLKAYLAKQVAGKLGKKPVDAKFIALKDGFKIQPEQSGAQMDMDAAVGSISERIPDTAAEPVELSVKVVQPHVVASDLQGIEGEVSSFHTPYSERGNRRKNILVACDKINGTVLKPGDRFSYNSIVGPRDEGAGFKMAPVIIKGKLVPGMGGGVCQVSSTLYNAVLLANLKIVRREHHAFPVHYLPAGRDATVAYGSIDFVFENDTKVLIGIAASGEGQQVSMRIFGKKAPGREVQIQRTNVSSWGGGEQVVHDSSIGAGKRKTLDKGHAGHRVTVWRIVKENGAIVKREVISHDHYRAFPRIVAVGPEIRKTVPPPLTPGQPPPAVTPQLPPNPGRP